VGAAVGQARVARGQAPGPVQLRRAWTASAFTLVITSLIVYGGYKWWNAEAASYASDIYHPLSLSPALSGNTLDLAIGSYDPDDRFTFRARSNNDLLPDHGHLMHLYAIRQPGMDAVFHLHPELISPGNLRIMLPAMPPGDYRLYADVVHANGFPETLTANLTVPPAMPGAPLSSEDAAGAPPALSLGELGPAYKLPDGYTMIWDRPQELAANTAYAFRFRLVDPSGKPASDEQPYLGMAGHAAFVKTDGTVFAHTHPEGSAAMQSMMLANGDSPEMADMHPSTVEPVVEFPYGFPSTGRYRIFIQMKHGNMVETGAFDADVH
jgi:hypothetical protein